MKKNEVFEIKGTDIIQMTLKLLQTCDLAEDIGDRRKRIAIKPNLVVAANAKDGAVTHPEILEGVIVYLQEKGFSDITVMEGSWVGEKTPKALKVSGIGNVCKKYEVPFLDTQKDGHYEQTQGKYKLELSACVKGIDYLINLPVLKGHCQTIITCALKNMKGLIPNSEKRRFHSMGLHRPIAVLNKMIHQDFILVDNICGDLDFEEGGNPVPMNRLLAFKDPVLCDSFAAQSMGYQPHDIDYIRFAEELGVGNSDLSSAIITDLSSEGQSAEKPVFYPSGKVRRLEKFVIQKDACSACYGSLIHALNRLRETGIRMEGLPPVAIGQAYRGKTGKVGIGNCTHCFESNISGCPPRAVDIVEFLKTNWCENQ